MINSISPSDQQTNKQLRLTISIVTFNPDFAELEKTLCSLKSALQGFTNNAFQIIIVDNSTDNAVASFLEQKFDNLPIQLIHGQGNIGFGRAHNMALKQTGEFHLILNPDIELDSDALVNAIAFMRSSERCGLLSPRATWPDGKRQYLCKRYPAVFDLVLRGFAPQLIRSFFSMRLARYEMKAETQSEVFWNPPIVSGCFMFFRGAILRKAGGFSDKFFLYFEDFDLSLRCAKIAETAYVPSVKVVHSGGHASRKGIWHIRVFVRSAITFYRIHGLKIV
ncbi:glycosyl transferase family protein [Ochrobactrum sp. CDB2]|nr:glycosyl transferase family protein [Ochrobactrum sp. CDB2]